MNTRLLYPLVPAAALAAAYLAWGPENPGDSVDVGMPEQGPPVAAVPAATPGLLQAPAQSRSLLAAESAPARQCDLVPNFVPVGDGTVIDRSYCRTADPGPARRGAHPYEAYPSAALESLAYSDAKAAEVLGMRLRETDEARAISLVLRSSALSGDIAPILTYAQVYPAPSEIDGVPVRKTVHTKFVLAAVADLMSDDTHYVAAWEDTIRRYSTDPEKEIALLQAQATRIVEELRHIQLTVTGNSTFGGQDDA